MDLFFQTYHASFCTVSCKSTWLSAIRTHCLPALLAFSITCVCVQHSHAAKCLLPSVATLH